MRTYAPTHGNQCRCLTCAPKLKAQYQAYRDGAKTPEQHWAIRTTAPQEVGAGLEMSLRFLQPKLDEIAALKRQLAERDYVLLAILHGTDKLRDDIESEVWEDAIYASTMRDLKALADADQERKATR